MKLEIQVQKLKKKMDSKKVENVESKMGQKLKREMEEVSVNFFNDKGNI